MSDKKILVVDLSNNDKTAKFRDADEILSGNSWVDKQETSGSESITVDDKEEVRRANLYIQNDSDITINYGGSVYVTDGINSSCCEEFNSGQVLSANAIPSANGLGQLESSNWSVSSSGSLEPTLDNTYDIGNPSNRVRDLFLGPSSLKISKSYGSSDFSTISSDGKIGNLVFKANPASGSAEGLTKYVFENSHLGYSSSSELLMRGGNTYQKSYLSLKTHESMSQNMILKFPPSPGSSNQVLSIDPSSSGDVVNLVWSAPSSGGLSDIVEDLTPQLGGNLDSQDNNIVGLNSLQYNSGPEIKGINFDRSLYLNPKYGTSHAENSVRIGNIGAASSAVDNGKGTDISKLESEAESFVIAANNFSDTSYVQINHGENITDSQSRTREGIELRLRESSNSIASVSVKSVSLNATNSVSATRSPQLRLYSPQDLYVSIEAPALSSNVNFVLPSTDGSANQVLKTDGSGVLDWVNQTSEGLLDVAGDTTPQLGGDLDVNGNSLTSTLNGDVNISPNGTGNLVVSSDINMGTNLITDDKVGNWDEAYGWGDHSAEGYSTTDTNTFRTVVAGGNTLGAAETLTLSAGTNVSLTESAGTVTVSSTYTNTQLSDEEVQDVVGGMVTGNTETNMSVTYNDSTGKLNFSATDTNTFRTVQAGGNTLGSSETLNIVGGTGVTVSESGGTVTLSSSGSYSAHAQSVNLTPSDFSTSTSNYYNNSEYICWSSTDAFQNQFIIDNPNGFSVGDIIVVVNTKSSQSLTVETRKDGNLVSFLSLVSDAGEQSSTSSLSIPGRKRMVFLYNGSKFIYQLASA